MVTFLYIDFTDAERLVIDGMIGLKQELKDFTRDVFGMEVQYMLNILVLQIILVNILVCIRLGIHWNEGCG
ncbi:MAG: hypothetical protein JNM14_15310 [Ferruginibacter sp.]|nr:hypothetical protein [Ferruginibacter sp.]